MRNLLLLASVFALSACNTTGFGSEGRKTAGKKEPVAVEDGDKSQGGDPGKPPLDTGENADLAIDCAPAQGGQPRRIAVHGRAGQSLAVNGTLCGLPDARAKAEATVMFIVDVSGSMVQNDPVVNGSCGRLEAAKAIVGLLDQTATASDGVHLGVLGFADVVAHSVDPIPLSMFRAKLSSDVFCAMRGGGTNYDAALTQTVEVLKGLDGPKAVYFISDGLPTRAGLITSNPVTDGLVGDELLSRIQELGLNAAKKLRESIRQLFFYAVFLDSGDGKAADAEKYLISITGSAEWVRLVSRAEDLASVITSFKPPQAAAGSIASATATAGIIPPGKDTPTPIPLASFSRDAKRLGTYHFETVPLKLDGMVGVTSEYELELVLDLGDGKKATEHVILAFTPDGQD